MKLATYKNDSRDGQLMLVSRDLKLTCSAAPVVKTMQQLLDNWDELFEPLNERYQALCSGELLAEKFAHSIGCDRNGEQIPANQQFSCESGPDCFLKVVGSHVKTNLRYKMINNKGFAICG